MPITSSIGPATAVAGLLLQVGNAGSPETMNTIANVTDVSVPVVKSTVEVTNVGDLWRRHFPTLNDMGKIAFKIFWMMEEPTHRNSLGGGSVGAGLRYLLINGLLRDFGLTYNDGNGSTDSFPAYVVGFMITGKTGSVWEAQIELTNSGAPSLV